MNVIINTYVVLLGLCMGSFGNVIVYRLPRGESIVTPPSACPQCGHKLGAIELIPLVGYAVLRGSCKHCRCRISPTYPLWELAMAALFLLLRWRLGVSWALLPLCALGFVLLCVARIDAVTQTIPDGLLIFGLICGVLWVGASHFLELGAPEISESLIGIVTCAIPLLIIDKLCIIIAGKDAFGFGDVKLAAVCGMFLGWQLSVAALVLSVITGGAYGAWLLAVKRVEKGSYMAFGPFLGLGVIIVICFGTQILKLYLPGYSG